MTLAVLLMACGVYFFKFPNNFALGGVTGISVVVGKLIKWQWLTPAVFTSILNIVLLVLGFAFLGKKFGFKTVYCSLLLSLFLNVFELLIPISAPLTNDTFLELFFAVICSSVASAIVFNLGGSTGGMDIVAMIIKKIIKVEIGKALLIADLIIVLSTFFVFDIKTGLYSLFGLAITSLLIDSSIENINQSKYFTIITTRQEIITEYITQTLKRGATKLDGEGCYTHEGKAVILTVMNRNQARKLREYVRQVDPQAFILISNTSDIIGRGFRPSV